METILITGATGKVGEALTAKLRDKGVRLRLGTRSSGKTADAVWCDFDRPETFEGALSGVDRLFLLTSGGTEREGPLVEAARRAGVRHVVKLSVWEAQEEVFAFARAHRAVEKKIESSGLPWTFLRPNGYMQNFSTAMAQTIRQAHAFYFPSDFSHSIVDVRDVAEVATVALTRPGHEGKAYQLSGPEALSNSRIAEKLSAALGKPITFVPVSKAAFREGLLGAGVPEPYADDYLDLIRYYETGAAQKVKPDVEKVTGRSPTSFDQFARDFASVWR